MYGVNDTSFKKYRLWRSKGSTISSKSQLGMEIDDNNANQRTISAHEVESVIKKHKAYNALYFWPISNILEYMARNGKVNGMYLNWKQGWQFDSITHEEIVTKNKIEWKVRHEKYEDFVEDIVQIRNYRIQYINKNTEKEEAIAIIDDMLKEEWTMNTMDGNVTRKQLWHKYRGDTIKVMNLEFRLKDNAISKGITEVPIVIDEDNGQYFLEMYNSVKLQAIEEKWEAIESNTVIPNRKKKKATSKKTKASTKQMRIGTEELLNELKEMRNLFVAIKKKETTRECEISLDKFDQIRQVERSIHDDKTKEIMVQVILSRQDNDDLQYKMLEEKLLSGKHYLVQMPRIEKIRTNILGMAQEINECAPNSWNDESLIDRLQIITGQRIKKRISHELKKITEVLVQYKKEMEMINELKTHHETKDKFDIVSFKDELRRIIEEKEYENVQYEFLERWCEEIESNINKGFTKKNVQKTNTMRKIMDKPSTSKESKKRNRFTISSDSEDSFEIVKKNRLLRTKPTNNEIVISSDSNGEINTSTNSSEIIMRENDMYVEISTDEE